MFSAPSFGAGNVDGFHVKMAHPARFELTTSAFGGHSTGLFWGFLILAVN